MSKALPEIRCHGRSNCFACELRHEMLCSHVSLEDLVNFHAGIDDYDYDHGSILYHAASPMDAVYCVRHGAVMMVKPGLAGALRIVRMLKTGDVAGIESAFSEAFEHTAIAVGEVRACRIPIACLRRFVAEHGGLQMRLLEKLQGALREAETWLSQLASGPTPTRTRMARLMLRLRVGAGDRIHRLSLDDMGAIIGITPETVSRIISEFVGQGIIAKCGSNVAHHRCFRGDIRALETIAQGV